MPTFTSGNDTYTVSAAGSYDLDMLGGDDRLNVYGGTTVTAHLGDGNDYAVLKAALTTIFGDAGADRLDIYAASATVDGGADDDMVNVRGGTGLTASGGLGDDRFNFIVDTSSITIDGGEGNDAFVGYYHSISGTIMGGAGNDSFVQFIGGVNLYGGLGNDIYQIGVTSHAAIFENPNEGNDTVQVARGYSYTLLDNFENLVVASLAGSTLSAAMLTGNALANYITAGNNDDSISGLDGNDHLFGKGGNDTIDGGNGNDLVDGGAGNDVLIGGGGNDTLVGRAGNDAMVGGAGNDIYYVDSLGDVISENLGEGTDTVRVAIDGYILAANLENGIVQVATGLSLTGNGLNNVLTGNAGNDVLWGGNGNDYLDGGSGYDTLYGEGGNDVINGRGGDDVMVGGAGDDTYYVDGAGDSIAENAYEGIDLVRSGVDYTLPDGVENGILDGSGVGHDLNGNGLSNQLTGNSFDNTIHGYSGADTLTGAGGNDVLWGEEGDDVLNGGTGDDYMYGGKGDDVFYVDSLGDHYEDTSVFSDDGYDVVHIAVNGYTLSTGSLGSNDVELAIIDVVSGAILYGSSSHDGVQGGLGDDTINGAGGDDYLAGGDGNDVLAGGDGADELHGEAGSDDLYGGDGADELHGEAGSDELYGGNGNDIYFIDATDHVYEVLGGGTFDAVILVGGGTWVVPDNVESVQLNDPGTLTGNDQGDFLIGSDGDDALTGGGGNDVLYGGATPAFGGYGNDVLNGGAGDDELEGGTGNDTLSGGDGSDLLLPGWGADTLTGGAGADIFRFDDYDSVPGALDAINDFVSGTGSEDDTLDLQFIDANESLSGDQAFTWIGVANFSGAAGQLRVIYGKDGTACHLYGDTDGDGVADFEVSLHLTGIGLNLDDIVL